MNTENTKQTTRLFFISLGILFILIALSFLNVVNAQPPQGQQGPPSVPNAKEIKKMVADVSKELSLSAEQESKISKIYVAHFDEIKEATSSGRPDRNKMVALKTKFEKEVNTVLTKDQQELFAVYQEKHNKERGGQRPTR